MTSTTTNEYNPKSIFASMPGLVPVADLGDTLPIMEWALPLQDGADMAPGFIDFDASEEEKKFRMSLLSKFPVAKDDASLEQAFERIVGARLCSCAQALFEVEDMQTSLERKRRMQEAASSSAGHEVVPYVANPLLKSLEDIASTAKGKNTYEVFWYGIDCVAGFYDQTAFYQTFKKSPSMQNISRSVTSTISLPSLNMRVESDTMLLCKPQDDLPKSLVSRIFKSLGDGYEEVQRTKSVVLYMPWIQMIFEDASGDDVEEEEEDESSSSFSGQEEEDD